MLRGNTWLTVILSFFSVNFTQLGISFDFSVELNDGSLIFRLDSDSIQETGKYMLGSVYFVPFFWFC